MSLTLLLSLALLLLAFMGAPLFAVIAGAALLGFHSADLDQMVVIVELYRIVDTPLLLALPFFTLAGYLLAESQTSQRLVRVTRALLGWLPGGLAIIAYLTCAFFTALTGASGVTIVAMGALLLPALQQSGYSEKFSLGLVTTSGSLGLLLAPSLPLILYGIIVQQMSLPVNIDIIDLFLAGIIPALLMIGLLSAWTLFSTSPVTHSTHIDLAEIKAAINEAKWEIPLPFVLLGCIYSGWVAISEAAAVTVFYLLIVEVFIYREISLRQLPGIMREAMIMVGGILLILSVSLGFTNFLVDAEVPGKLFSAIQTFVHNKYVFLILLNLILLVLGAILDIFAALVIVVPLIVPVALEYGIDPLHLGIIFLANMQIGYFTPPIGMNLFIASYRFRQPIITIYAACWPFMLILLLALLLITYLPILSLWLPGL